MKARPGELKLKFRTNHKNAQGQTTFSDFEAAWGGEGASKEDANWVLGFLTLSKADTIKAVMELERRGYDLKTLRFSIRRKKNASLGSHSQLREIEGKRIRVIIETLKD